MTSDTLDRRFCVAPMMEWTDRHCRAFHRTLSKGALLYTEMVTADALIHGDREGLKQGLWATVALGVLFSAIQAYEYSAAPFGFGGNTYSSAFYMATGFHGFHVLIGTIFLAVCLYRTYLGHFTPRQHFGFEAAAWYWHFVDVVWLFLFVAIYVWGGWGAEYH